jgi:hypothetical protein
LSGNTGRTVAVIAVWLATFCILLFGGFTFAGWGEEMSKNFLGISLLIVASGLTAAIMNPPVLRREFTVQLPLEKAWRHLARVEEWPSWAKHIKQVEVQPPGDLGPGSTGHMLLTNGFKPAWTVTEFNPYRNWKWVGGFLWLTVYYDHRFEELNPTQTKITFVVEAEGFGVSIIGRLFAKIYSKNLDRAIGLLVQEMNASGV